MADETKAVPEIIIVAPLQGDAAALAACVEKMGFSVSVIPAASVQERLNSNALLLIVTEEALVPDFARELIEWASVQPEWSALPILFLVNNPNSPPPPLKRLLRETNGCGYFTTTLGRPVAPEIFRHTVAGAIGSRYRQFRIRDQIDEIERANAQIELLAREIGHRAKNNLQMLSGLLHQTFRQSGNIEVAVENFEARLAAMSRSVSLLDIRKWKNVNLNDLVSTEMAVMPDNLANRVQYRGPSVELDAERAMAVQLLLHELITNAVKYGALSAETGQVILEWRIDQKDDDTRACLKWSESGGPPVTPPSTKGFGSKLMKAIGFQLGGEVSADYPVTGLEFKLEWPYKGKQV